MARRALAEADATGSPEAHVITRWLGADLAEPEPHIARFEPPGPGVVLVCSDGLWNYRSEAAGLAALALPAALTDSLGAAGALAKFALAAGGATTSPWCWPRSPWRLPGRHPSRWKHRKPFLPRLQRYEQENSAMTEPCFTVDLDQNPTCPRAGADLSVIVTVTSAADTRAADFAAMMESAMGKQVADVALRVWTPPEGATVTFVKQVAPTVDDLTGRRMSSGPQSGDYPTGAWGPGESRDDHIGVQVAPGEIGQERLAARVSLVAQSCPGPKCSARAYSGRMDR